MGYKQTRRIVRFGVTYNGTVLPKGRLEFHQLRHGDEVALISDSVLLVCPRGEEAKARTVLKLAAQGGMESSSGRADDHGQTRR